jgi:hypothetical protein
MDQEEVIRTFEEERGRSRARATWIFGGLAAFLLIAALYNAWAQNARPRTDAELLANAKSLVAKSDLQGLSVLWEGELARTDRDYVDFQQVCLDAINTFTFTKVHAIFNAVISGVRSSNPKRAANVARLLVTAETNHFLAQSPKTWLVSRDLKDIQDLDLALQQIPSGEITADEKAMREWTAAEAEQHPTLDPSPTMEGSADANAFHACAQLKEGMDNSLTDLHPVDFKNPLAAFAVTLHYLDVGDAQEAVIHATYMKSIDPINPLSTGLDVAIQEKQDEAVKSAQADQDAQVAKVKALFETPNLTEPEFWKILAAHTHKDFTATQNGKPTSSTYDLAQLAKSDYPDTVTATATITSDSVEPKFSVPNPFARAKSEANDEMDQTLGVSFAVPGSTTSETYTLSFHWHRVQTEFMIDRIALNQTQSDPNTRAASTPPSIPAPTPPPVPPSTLSPLR